MPRRNNGCAMTLALSPSFLAASSNDAQQRYSTVTDFARLRGLSTSVPRASAA